MTTWFYTVSPPPDAAVIVGQKTATAYARQLRKLLPPGRLWRTDLSSYIMRVFLAIGDELSRISGRAIDMIAEADPRTTSELLTDFERALDLEASASESEGQARIVARITQDRGFRPEDIQETLAPLLAQDVVDVSIIERDTSDAAVIANAREIYRYFVFRDPLEPGTPDLEGAQTALTLLEHSHTKGTVIETTTLRCDEATSLTDRDPLGV